MKTIYLAGDSTCAGKTEDVYPETGWGQKLPEFLTGDIAVSNHAVNGRSTKSFMDEGRLDAIAKELKPGDWLFVQFGHNDQKDDPERYSAPFSGYQDNLRDFVRRTREKGAEALFLTPIYRRHFEGDRLEDRCHGDYPDAMKALGRELDIPLVDMTAKTREWLESIGERASREYFLIAEAGQYENYPEGKEDNTHLSEKGAETIASFVAEGLREIPGLGGYVR